MPSFHNVLLCALAELLVSLCVGLPVARRLVSDRPLAPALAPIGGLGRVQHAGAADPVLGRLYPRDRGASRRLRRSSAGLRRSLSAVVEIGRRGRWRRRRGLGLRRRGAPRDGSGARCVAEIPRRRGRPQRGDVRPFESGDHRRHRPARPAAGQSRSLPAAALGWSITISGISAPRSRAALFGASGWEADIALTWFTAFASLALMMGLAVWLGGRRLAALWSWFCSVSPASLKPLLSLVLPADFLGRALFLITVAAKLDLSGELGRRSIWPRPAASSLRC